MIIKNYIFLSLFILFSGKIFADEKPSLTFYVGSTMAQAMSEIANIVEKRENCDIKIVQGASKSLYNLIKNSQKGDIFLPGSHSFIVDNLKDGLLLDSQYVGYNQAVICVKKLNPKNIRSLDDFLDENIATMLCDPNRGSIGRATKKIFSNYKGDSFLQKAYDNSVRIALDSKDLYQVFNEGKIDANINWRATFAWSKDKNIEMIKIDEKYAPKSELFITLLKFSKYPQIAKNLIYFTASQEGQSIMKKHGFRD
jgi:molybdate transport system substrate-binding protein